MVASYSQKQLTVCNDIKRGDVNPIFTGLFSHRIREGMKVENYK